MNFYTDQRKNRPYPPGRLPRSILSILLIGGLVSLSAQTETVENPPPIPPKEPPPLPKEILEMRPAAPPPIAPPDLSSLRERLELLDQFLSLPPERLVLIRQTIESIEKMQPQEKENLRKAVDQFFRLHPDQQQSLTLSWQQMSPADRELLRRRWLQLTPAEREEERKKTKALTPAQRRQYEAALLLQLRRQNAESAPPEIRIPAAAAEIPPPPPPEAEKPGP